MALAGTAFAASAGPLPLAPQLPGQYKEGTGIDAHFLEVPDAWQQSSVLWNQATGQFGSGVPVSDFGWGSGLWGIADWATANHSPAPGMIEASWSGRVSQIAFGDQVYNSLYGASWGAVDLAPLFGSGSAAATQDNWTSRFSGYIRISEAGSYNFSVLYDDGFFFRLGGAGQTLALEQDYLNPRDSLGFASDLQLGVGLYAFELGAYDRLEAGVVELSWARDGGAWTRVPTAHLVASGDVIAVPEPSGATLMLTALLALAWRRRALRR